MISEWQKDAWLLAVPALLFFYYFIVWLLVGREPQRGIAVVRYDPPEGITPAAARYLWIKGSDGRSLAAVLADLAGRGIVRVTPDGGAYRVEPLLAGQRERMNLPPEEAHVCRLLFDHSPSVLLRPDAYGPLSLYVNAIQQELQKRLEGKCYTRNLGYLLSGAGAAFAFAVTASFALAKKEAFTAGFLCVWFLFCGWILGSIVVINVVPALGRMLRGMEGGKTALIGLLVLSFFGLALGFVLRLEARASTPMMSVVLVLLLVLPLTWGPALRRMTPLGRQTLEEIEGFRLFLRKVEQDRLERVNSPGQAPAEANTYLAFAIALEIREAWGDHFAEAFAGATTQK